MNIFLCLFKKRSFLYQLSTNPKQLDPNKIDLKPNKNAFYFCREEKLYRFPRNTHNKNQGIYVSVGVGEEKECVWKMFMWTRLFPGFYQVVSLFFHLRPITLNLAKGFAESYKYYNWEKKNLSICCKL